MKRVVLDTNVLWGSYLRDLLLTLAYQETYDPRWCERIIDALSRHLEPQIASVWMNKMLRENPSLDQTIAHERSRTVARKKISLGLIPTIRKRFAAQFVPNHEWEPFLSTCTNDPDDRHVLATAIACKATHIVTENIKDFPLEALKPHGIEAIRLDPFLASFDPEKLLDAIDTILKRHKSPPKTREEYLKLLGETLGCSQTARFIRAYLKRETTADQKPSGTDG